eukprot:s292_g28.t1
MLTVADQGHPTVPAVQDQQQAFEAELRQDRRFTAFLARRDFDAFLSRKAQRRRGKLVLAVQGKINSWLTILIWLSVHRDGLTQTSQRTRQPSLYKSRLVARGDLGKSAEMRADSPTSSQLFLHTIVSYSVCKKRRLRGGDISAAFLQETRIKRKLGLRLPADGIPDESVAPGSLLICEKRVYGTCDAPRGFWKELYRYAFGVWAAECANGDISILPAWTASSSFVAQRWRDNRITRGVGSGEGDLHRALTLQAAWPSCDSVRNRTAEVSGWKFELVQSCLPTRHGVPGEPAPSRAAEGRVEDLMIANRLLNHALETRDKGVHFPADAFSFEDAVILCINDASHAASVDVTDGGHTVGHRSQSGRLLLASKEFLKSGHGKIHLLQW